VDLQILEPQIVDVLADEGLAAEIAMRRPAVLALTLYVWNAQRSLFLASNVKKRSPETTILVGGPEVTPDNPWVMEHPAVDAGVFGEGESRIGPVLEALLVGREPIGIPGTFAKTHAGLRIEREPAAPWDTASNPYPYLDGRITPSRDGTLFLETVRGCPFRCRYCYYHKAFKGMRRHPERSVDRVLDFAYSSGSKVREIYLMDPTFNARPGFRELLSRIARRRNQHDVALHTELRGDLITREDADLLRDAGLKSAEVGLQSINPEVLRTAGRSDDPEKVATGVGLLMERGIEVTTGIILGLPGDTPEGFLKTVEWLKRTSSYSVVHPFVLSVLPGTDFRAQAQGLGLTFDPRPPYYVRSTPTFPAGEFRSALEECERILEMELDYIQPPSLVDSGPNLTTGPEDRPYISKWIVDPARTEQWRPILGRVVACAADPFTIWFRGCDAQRAEQGMLEMLEEFASRNPHSVMAVVLEYPEPPRVQFFDEAFRIAGQPSLFVSKSFAPLYGEGVPVSINFTIILPDPGDSRTREMLMAPYRAVAAPAWDLGESPGRDFRHTSAPLLISHSMPAQEKACEEMLDALQDAHKDHVEEVLFRDQFLYEAWRRRTGPTDPTLEIPERILLTV